MKQIFDWLREQINAEIKECQEFYRAQNNDSVCKCVMQGNVNAYAKSLSLIDEAEAKWEAVIEQMEEYRAKFDCRTCKYNKAEGQVCTKDCTDALIDGMLEILKGKISEVE